MTERCASPEHGSKPAWPSGSKGFSKEGSPDDTCELGLESDQFIPEPEEREIQKECLQEKNKEIESSPSCV